MPYLRCEACSAKALPIASRCPTCEAPFPEVRPEGFRPCRGCESLIDPASEACRWCEEPVRKGPSRSLLVGTGLGLVALLLVGGAFATGGESTSPEAVVASADLPTATESPPPDAGTDAPDPPPASTEGNDETLPPSSDDDTTPPEGETEPSSGEPVDEPEPTPPSTTSGWVRAVATTFVNIRSAPGSESEVQGIVPQDSEVLLGSANGDWREVRSGELTGWAWEPLFTLSSEGP